MKQVDVSNTSQLIWDKCPIACLRPGSCHLVSRERRLPYACMCHSSSAATPQCSSPISPKPNFITQTTGGCSTRFRSLVLAYRAAYGSSPAHIQDMVGPRTPARPLPCLMACCWPRNSWNHTHLPSQAENSPAQTVKIQLIISCFYILQHLFCTQMIPALFGVIASLSNAPCFGQKRWLNKCKVV